MALTTLIITANQLKVCQKLNNQQMNKNVFPQKAKPFLKWAGGKQQLLSQYDPFFPAKVNRYFEPFVGGGAVFFHLWNKNLLNDEISLFDNNQELINVYRIVRDEINKLIECLSDYKGKHSKQFYYEIRFRDRDEKKYSDVERAARTIYLNKTCYNGLYRVNSKGQFNVPMGSYKNPQIIYPDILRTASTALKKTSLETLDFVNIVDYAKPGDFFYFDPPYHPVSKTANFTSYTAGNFNENDQKKLAEIFFFLTKMGCLCMLSNSHTPLIDELYKTFKPMPILANRAINSDANGRVGVKELLVINYNPKNSKIVNIKR